MPPYKKPTSEAQRRYMFVLADRGDIPMSDAIGKSRAVKGRKLPKHVAKRKPTRRGRRRTTRRR